MALEPTTFAPAYTYLARLELEAQSFDRAVTQAAKGALLLDDAEAYYWLGEAYRARGGTASDGSARQRQSPGGFRAGARTQRRL